MERIAGAG